jgi:hypothetical protein
MLSDVSMPVSNEKIPDVLYPTYSTYFVCPWKIVSEESVAVYVGPITLTRIEQ